MPAGFGLRSDEVRVLGIKKPCFLFGSRAGKSDGRLFSHALLPAYPNNQVNQQTLCDRVTGSGRNKYPSRRRKSAFRHS